MPPYSCFSREIGTSGYSWPSAFKSEARALSPKSIGKAFEAYLVYIRTTTDLADIFANSDIVCTSTLRVTDVTTYGGREVGQFPMHIFLAHVTHFVDESFCSSPANLQRSSFAKGFVGHSLQDDH
jgi:hypothetical protein